jgi:hypothetical protein
MHLPPEPPRREVPPDLRVLARQIGNGRDRQQTNWQCCRLFSAGSCCVFRAHCIFVMKEIVHCKWMCAKREVLGADEWASPHSWNPRHQHLCFKSYAHVNHEFAKAPPPRMQDRTAEGLQGAESWVVWVVMGSSSSVHAAKCQRAHGVRVLVRHHVAHVIPLQKGALHWTV